MHTSPRLLILVAAILLAGGLALGAQETLGNQQGPGVNDRTNNMIGLCRLNFGIEEVTTVRTPASGLVGTKVLCIGGPLDGLFCLISKDATICDWSNVGAASQTTGSPQEVVTNVEDLTFVTDLATDDVTPLTLEVAIQPVVVEAVFSWNPSADAATQATMTQVNACRQLGGTELVARAGDNPAASTIQCDGGLLDGMWCSIGVGVNACFFVPETADAATPGMATTVPAEPPMPTEVMPTVAMPTEAPTEAPTMTAPTATVAPTDVPVIEPTFVDTGPDNPWDVPEGPLQPLEPAPDPTEPPLT